MKNKLSKPNNNSILSSYMSLIRFWKILEKLKAQKYIVTVVLCCIQSQLTKISG